jgi:uncharacterized protein YcbK (DUF882 family)
MKRIIIVAVALFLASAALAGESPLVSRYFYHGDGVIAISSGRGAFSGRYRLADGSYDPTALKRINRVFGASMSDPASSVSIRFIEFLDYLQDHFNPRARIQIASGYRSPDYNTRLREDGKLAAPASLHQYGMAADLSIAGVPPDVLWEYVKGLGFGGAGYYHGRLTHVDVGPARSWDEATSGVGTDISTENKLIGIIADKDVYRPGEAIELRFIRMTAYPVGVVPAFALEREDDTGRWKEAAAFAPAFGALAEGSCPHFEGIRALAGIRWQLPAVLAPGRYRVRAPFCDRASEAMPAAVETPAFEVVGS